MSYASERWNPKGAFVIIEFFSNIQPYKSFDPLQLVFIEDLVLFIAKGYVPLFVVESS